MRRNELDPTQQGGQSFNDFLRELHGLPQDFEKDKSTKIIKMPNQLLTKEERRLVYNKLFPMIRDSLPPERAKQFNEESMQKADAIIVELGRSGSSKGFIGDIIQESRLVEALDKRFPGKVYTRTDRLDLFGKFKHVTGLHSNFFQLSLSYKESEDGSPKKTGPKSVFIVKPEILYKGSGKLVIPRGSKPILLLPNEFDLEKVKNMHMQHVAQTMWEFLYGVNVDELPEPAIKISERNLLKAKELSTHLPTSNSLNIIIHPDAAKRTYLGKKWAEEKWIQLLGELAVSYPNAAIFISRGVDHPEVTDRISKEFTAPQSIHLLPQLSLPQYAGLLDQFPKDKTIFVGLESMAASHLAPSLGLKSIALSHIGAYCLYYGPWKGLVVASATPPVRKEEAMTKGITVEKVIEAIETLREIE